MIKLEKNTVLLSELQDDELLSFEDSHYTLSPSQLREQIKIDESLKKHTWYVAVGQEWHPDAKYMIERFIENEYNNGMYEGWDERALDCLKQEHYDRIQVVLDEAFSDDHATKYWMLDGSKVVID